MNQRRALPRAIAACATLTLGTTSLALAGTESAHADPVVDAAHYSGSLSDGATWIADVPARWNGTLILYSHGFGNLTAQDAPDPATKKALLDEGYALVGSSYSGGLWALPHATKDQFASLKQIERHIGTPRTTLAFGTSMGGLVSAQEAQIANGRLDGVLTTCGLVGGGVNLNNYQLDGEYAIATLLTPAQHVKLVNYANAGEAAAAAKVLGDAVKAAQDTPAGRARIALAAAFLNTPTWGGGDEPPARHEYAKQEAQQAAQLPGQLQFVISARPSIEQAAGGNASWNVGVDYRKLLLRSSNRHEVNALYRAAGISLKRDLQTLNRHETIRPNTDALRSLRRTSTVSGHLDVPELDLHTISDTLSPIAYENYYRRLVHRSGDGALLRQAYVKSIGHCNFSTGELVAGVHAIESRVHRGHWGSVATPARLNREVRRTGLGDGRFLRYHPPVFVNARSYRG